ncbi:MAG: hypothetical protein GTN89_10820 [Acidobacteria bacterium]|nr:hypothetical protein [Acidobacteriota bacterium]NIM63822.1 hypothetical protein [Acidobacteriota bacterium]NIO59756.1 hypothetical protein [Acidobacteriota bacterium]NIQ30839.1 hypothetical protein [Acidobacteriota bacterium]NIQ85912.1 hypothetical protein [Acidobacteriota bacterium]
MATTWCPVCGTPHENRADCPGELISETPERHGWRVNVETPSGIEAYGVLVAKTNGGLWRSRVLTYPNVLWAIPGGSGTIKFAADSPVDAERQAIEFIRAHCRERGFALRNEVALSTPEKISGDAAELVQPVAATRIIRFLPIRFGVVNPSEIGGTGNLSETGLFVITNHPLDVNTRLRLLLDVADNPLTLTGDVRWMNSNPRVGRSPGMGVQLYAPPDQYADYVRTL